MTRKSAFIPFNRAHLTGDEFSYMEEAIRNGHLAGNGPFSRECCEWLERTIGTRRALLTHSCTGALELALTLANVSSGDEVILPSFTFVTTANAVVARGGTPVFVDIRSDTLCLDERLVEAAITDRTAAIVPVHYAGVACEMGVINDLAAGRELTVIEDAAHGVGAFVNGRPLGGLGHLGALSFHETKNISCGEGGSLLINHERFLERAEIVHEKGTNRQQFFRGMVDKYTWVDVGSSYALSDLAAAYLWAQLQNERAITAARLGIWDRYHEAFAELESTGLLRRPVVPPNCEHNAHMYYLLVEDLHTRTAFIDALAAQSINTVFHYVPLHLSKAGHRFGRSAGSLEVTTRVADQLVRLPLWADMTPSDVDRVITAVTEFVQRGAVAAPSK